MGWPDASMREQYDGRVRYADSSALRQQTATNDAEIRARQGRQRTVPEQSVGNDLVGRLSAGEADTKTRIGTGRAQVTQDAGSLSQSYKSSVRLGKISPNHGGNRAVWDTVGANASEPNLGTPPKFQPLGEWHFDKDGVPVAGPEPKPPTPTPKSGTDVPADPEKKDRGSESGKR